MYKKLLSLFMALIMSVMTFGGCNLEVEAEEIISEDVTITEVMTENALIGYMTPTTKGVYLFSGNSIINDAGGGKVGWGAITDAARTCKVSATAILERLDSGSWVRVTSATNTVASGLSAVVSRATLVGSGYYYRVRGVHEAGTDTGFSYTAGLYM